MGVATLPLIRARLIAAGRDPATPAAVIHHATTEAQEVVTGALGELDRWAARVAAPAVVVIGEVVAIRAWVEHDGLHALDRSG